MLYLSSTSNHNLLDYLGYQFVVVLYLSSTSNHNSRSSNRFTKRLCYIFLLHQTTTITERKRVSSSCVISFFYIKPQHKKDISIFAPGCVISFFYIKPQLKNPPLNLSRSCVISFFYIKPQPSEP